MNKIRTNFVHSSNCSCRYVTRIISLMTKKQKRFALFSALSRLGDRQLKMFIRLFFLDQTQEQICEAMGLTGSLEFRFLKYATRCQVTRQFMAVGLVPRGRQA